MKKILIVISLFVIYSSIHSQTIPAAGFYGGVHDSLLFDGADDDGSGYFLINADNCKIKVVSVSGIATGTRCKLKHLKTCGEIDTVEVCKPGQIFPDDKLKAGDRISTGSNGHLTIMLSDGKTIRFANNTSIIINSNYCTNNFKTQVSVEYGTIYVNAKPNKDIKGLNVTSDYGSAVIEGTEFSYQSTTEGGVTTDVLKVFDGAVSFGKNMESKANRKISEEKSKNMSDKGKELQKLADDYKNGKITVQEYTDKMQELMKASEDVQQQTKVVMVNAGYQSTVIGTDEPTDPSPLDDNEVHWWEEK